ncbi:hypothetical protein [Acinetobacter shaoyimingii]|uniref:Uncharacterized protein n=1 Tax=Acinetobacter shaoyimingii TaxID=2715164 RepID=A0A6G8RVX3_9GAMM|nr:hypothetical protein [Acinetobacter shaoyimingii]QIO06089.1 hypothetical protein G8E00_09050 [Acinetobacter shaoyimingii]
MKNLDVTVSEEQYDTMEKMFLADINKNLPSKMTPLKAIEDLSIREWFELSKFLMFKDISLANFAKTIAQDMRGF